MTIQTLLAEVQQDLGNYTGWLVEVIIVEYIENGDIELDTIKEHMHNITKKDYSEAGMCEMACVLIDYVRSL